MKIAQITDIHIGPNDQPIREVDVRKNFIQTLELANTYGYDYLVISGDLCFQDAQPHIYAWVQRQLEKYTDKPVFVIPGNHDNAEMLVDHMNVNKPLQHEELFYAHDLSGHTVYFLDSGKGYLSSDQKHWLRDSLQQNQEESVLVFMHHPPAIGLVPHMDGKYALTDRDEVINIFSNSGKRIHLFCGHYHVDKSIHIGNISIHITPSTFMQIDQRIEPFRIDHTRPGFRLIDWNEMGIFEQVVYLT